MTIKEQIAYVKEHYAGSTLEMLLPIWEKIEQMNEDILGAFQEIHRLEKPPAILQVKLLSPDARVPTRGSAGAIGWDLYAVNDEQFKSTGGTLSILPQGITAISTGISVAVPHGYYGRIAPRSGLAIRHGVDVLAGVVDEDYRGGVKVLLCNVSEYPCVIDLSKPIAQLILERADSGTLMVVEELLETARGSGGFGSTDRE